jgi:hypothetical protein
LAAKYGEPEADVRREQKALRKGQRKFRPDLCLSWHGLRDSLREDVEIRRDGSALPPSSDQKAPAAPEHARSDGVAPGPAADLRIQAISEMLRANKSYEEHWFRVEIDYTDIQFAARETWLAKFMGVSLVPLPTKPEHRYERLGYEPRPFIEKL